MIYRQADLRAHYSRYDIDCLVDRGALLRAGRFYATPETDDAVRAALSHGARATCLTAAKHHGLWVPPGPGLHAYTRRGQGLPHGWVDHGWSRSWPEPDPVASPALMLEHASRCRDPLDVGILADSAVHMGSLTLAEIAVVQARTPRRVHRVLNHVSALAESGTESKVRLFLQLRGVMVRAQVPIAGIGRVDLLVGRRWIIECDSRAHHTGEERYEYDRERDITALELGYFTTRLTYGMVFGQWDRTARRLLGVVDKEQHLHAPGRWACA